MLLVGVDADDAFPLFCPLESDDDGGVLAGEATGFGFLDLLFLPLLKAKHPI